MYQYVLIGHMNKSNLYHVGNEKLFGKGNGKLSINENKCPKPIVCCEMHNVSIHIQFSTFDMNKIDWKIFTWKSLRLTKGLVRLMLLQIRRFHWIFTWNRRNNRLIETRNSANQIMDTIVTQIQLNNRQKCWLPYHLRFNGWHTDFNPIFIVVQLFWLIYASAVSTILFFAFVLRSLLTVYYCHLHLVTIHLCAFHFVRPKCNVIDDNGIKEKSYNVKHTITNTIMHCIFYFDLASGIIYREFYTNTHSQTHTQLKSNMCVDFKVWLERISIQMDWMLNENTHFHSHSNANQPTHLQMINIPIHAHRTIRPCGMDYGWSV